MEGTLEGQHDGSVLKEFELADVVLVQVVTKLPEVSVVSGNLYVGIIPLRLVEERFDVPRDAVEQTSEMIEAHLVRVFQRRFDSLGAAVGEVTEIFLLRREQLVESLGQTARLSALGALRQEGNIGIQL